MLALHVSTVTATGPAATTTKGFFRTFKKRAAMKKPLIGVGDSKGQATGVNIWRRRWLWRRWRWWWYGQALGAARMC